MLSDKAHLKNLAKLADSTPNLPQSTPSADTAARFAQLFASYPLSALFANMQAQAYTLNYAGLIIPCTIVDETTPNCFTVSPHALIVDYAKDELVKLPVWQQKLLKKLLGALGGLLSTAKIDRLVTLNNYGLSTNTLSDDFQQCDVKGLTQHSCGVWQRHALAIRSLNVAQHPALLNQLTKLGWHLVVTRQIYLMQDWQAVFAKQNTRRDHKLLHDGRYVFRPLQPSSPDSYFEQATRWYNRLYLHKYSMQNVQFTPLFLREALRRGIIDLYLLYDTAGQQSVGVAGIVIDGQVATAPVVGYDDQRPQSHGLYRRCMAQVMAICQAKNLVLNFSAGSPDFKKVRGATPVIEYMAVYSRHSPWYQRAVWQIIAWLSGYYARILVRYGL